MSEGGREGGREGVREEGFNDPPTTRPYGDGILVLSLIRKKKQKRIYSFHLKHFRGLVLFSK